MVIILTALLAGSKVLPMVDRDALELQARAEALQPRTAPSRATPPPRRTTTATATPVRAATPRQTTATPRQIAATPRRASGGNPLDLAQITTICRAAGEQDDPAAFIGRLSSAYSLSSTDSTSLRSSCAAYLAGRADARRNSGGTY
ncbi:MAG TPA: hypothetical protein VLK25_11940 [Allosphingosinicella sp.]|nr:hypothetical protein [Allosphingosinicella sp.]